MCGPDQSPEQVKPIYVAAWRMEHIAVGLREGKCSKFVYLYLLWVASHIRSSKPTHFFLQAWSSTPEITWSEDLEKMGNATGVWSGVPVDTALTILDYDFFCRIGRLFRSVWIVFYCKIRKNPDMTILKATVHWISQFEFFDWFWQLTSYLVDFNLSLNLIQ